MGMRPQGNEQEARRNKHVRSAPSKIAVKALGEEVLDGILDKSPNPLLLILDCVQDPHNLGAILRTADGAGVGGGVGVAAIKNDALLQNRNALHFLRATAAHTSLTGHPDIESDRHRVEAAIELNRVNPDVRPQNFRALGTDGSGTLQNFVSEIRQIHAHILITVAIPTGIQNAIGLDAHGLSGGSAATRESVFRHNRFLL